jgi:hypothetical protein
MRSTVLVISLLLNQAASAEPQCSQTDFDYADSLASICTSREPSKNTEESVFDIVARCRASALKSECPGFTDWQEAKAAAKRQGER